MTDLQAELLYACVRAAKARGMSVPSALELVQSLPANRRIGARAMCDHLKRLNDTHRCFSKSGRRWFIDPANLVTEPESALYVLALIDACAALFKTSKMEFHDRLVASKSFDMPTLENMYADARRSQYVDETNPQGFIRPAHKTTGQLAYLKLLAADASPHFYKTIKGQA